MTCPDCAWEDNRYHRLTCGALEVICGLCDEHLAVVEVDYADA
jgi:hypothetical protein